MSIELVHALLHLAQQQQRDTKPVMYGHISSYDPRHHAVKVLIPHLIDANGVMTETEFIQLSSPAIGDGWGFQWHPRAGATPDNLEQGAQVQLSIVQRSFGLAVVASQFFNDNDNPPGAGDDTGTEDPDDPDGTNRLQEGEGILKHESGSFLKFYRNGDIQMFAANDFRIRAHQDLNVTVEQGDMNVEVQQGNLTVDVVLGDATITAEQGDVAVTATEGVAAVTAGTSATLSAGTSIEATAGTTASVTAGESIDVSAPLVNLGDPAVVQHLMNDAALLAYNEHVHPDAQGGLTGPPIDPLTIGIHTTVNTEAS